MFKKYTACLLALCVSATTLLAAPEMGVKNDPHYKATHQITMKNDEGEKDLCTASAIGPHALLTASHCDIGGEAVQLDNLPFDYRIYARIKDGEDHTIYLVGGPEFKTTMAQFYTPGTYNMAKIGERVFMYGDGGRMYPPQLRRGYRMDHVTVPPDVLKDMVEDGQPNDPIIFTFDIRVIGGDSGSAVYSAIDGRLVGLVTYNMYDQFMGMYTIKFTTEQYQQAVTFRP